MHQTSMENEERREYLLHAELLNGRVAMMGFVIGVLTEAITGVGIIGQVGSLFRGFGG